MNLQNKRVENLARMEIVAYDPEFKRIWREKRQALMAKCELPLSKL